MVWNYGNIKLFLTRGASVAMKQEKIQLLDIIQNVTFSTVLDAAIWQWEASGVFTIKSMYNLLNSGMFPAL